MSREWYPLLFSPIYRQAKWGGTLLCDYLQRRIPDDSMPAGESLEIVDENAIQSTVENGPLQGATLRDLIAESPEELVASRHSADDPFPLTLKYIDNAAVLPLQVHPDGAVCNRIEGARPNTKMWFVVNAWENATISVGIKRRCTQQQFRSRIGSSAIEKLVQSFPSEPGDAYFVMAGRVHYLGAGNLVFSVEQNSGTVFELSNWDPDETTDPDILGLALASVNFQDRTLARIRGESSVVERNRKIPLIMNCPYFTVDELRLVRELHDHTDGSSFHVITPVDGAITVSHQGVSWEVEAGRSCLFPATLGYYEIMPKSSEPISVLKTALRTA